MKKIIALIALFVIISVASSSFAADQLRVRAKDGTGANCTCPCK